MFDELYETPYTKLKNFKVSNIEWNGKFGKKCDLTFKSDFDLDAIDIPVLEYPGPENAPENCPKDLIASVRERLTPEFIMICIVDHITGNKERYKYKNFKPLKINKK